MRQKNKNEKKNFCVRTWTSSKIKSFLQDESQDWNREPILDGFALLQILPDEAGGNM